PAHYLCPNSSICRCQNPGWKENTPKMKTLKSKQHLKNKAAVVDSPSRRFLRVGYRCGLEPLESRRLLSVQPFVGCDLVVYRVGDGIDVLSNAGNPIFLDEYSPAGTLVQSIEMPFSSNSSDTQGGVHSPTAVPNPIVNAGSATPSGVIQLSADGRYLTFTGYAANLPNT